MRGAVTEQVWFEYRVVQAINAQPKEMTKIRNDTRVPWKKLKRMKIV